MPIVLNGSTFNNGGTATFGGTTLNKIIYSGTTVWQKSITLTNLLSAQADGSNQVDIGYNEGTFTKGTYTVTNGHKYFTRASGQILNTDWAWTPEERVSVGGTTVVSIAGNNAGTTANAVFNTTSTSCLWQMYLKGQGSTVGGNYWFYTSLYMLVDITPLEEATGRTYSAADFWSFIGGTVFYDSKSFTP